MIRLIARYLTRLDHVTSQGINFRTSKDKLEKREGVTVKAQKTQFAILSQEADVKKYFMITLDL